MTRGDILVLDARESQDSRNSETLKGLGNDFS